MMDFTGKAKWDAWKSREGLSQEEAKEKYVQAFKDILAKNDSSEAQDILKQV